MDFRFYIFLAIAYAVYSFYTRAKQKAAEQQKRNRQANGQPGTQAEPKAEENLFDKLRRLAEEAQAAAEAQQSGRPNPRQSAPMTSQEYPDEWVTTETGKQVRNLEGAGMRKSSMREEYNANRDEVRNVEGTMAEQLNRYKDENRSTEMSLTEEYLRSREQGDHVKTHGGKNLHQGKGMGKGKDGKRLNRFKETTPMQATRKVVHPLKKDLSNAQNFRRAFLMKELLDKPKGME